MRGCWNATNSRFRAVWLFTVWKNLSMKSDTCAQTGLKNASSWCAYRKKSTSSFWDMVTLTCLFLGILKNRYQFWHFFTSNTKNMVLFFDQVSYPVLNLPNLQIHNGTPEYYNICFTKTKTDNSQKNKKEMSFKTFGDNDSREHLWMFL